jgi:hypothetical protein
MEKSVVVAKVILSVGSKFVGTNSDSFEADSIPELNLALDPSLHLGSEIES